MSKNTFKQGPRYKFKDQVFWAEGGLICIENQNNGDFKVITRAEAAARIICLNDELPHFQYADERDELCRCVVNMCEAIKEAKRQGDPTNPEVAKQLIREKKRTSVLFDFTPNKDVSNYTLILPNVPQVSDRFRKLRL